MLTLASACRMARSIKTLAVAAGVLALPAMAMAHPGHGTQETSGFAAGFFHPVSGLDHVLAMVAVGLLAFQVSTRQGGTRKAMWLLPTCFVAAMVVGGLLGLAGMPFPFVEYGVLASVFVFGALIVSAVNAPVGVIAGLCALLAIFHGYAHGTEMPAGASAVGYASGFMLATMLLHVAGIVGGALIARLTPEDRASAAVRLAGAAIAASTLLIA